jgi:succinate dehydrogenase / fumarate reductase cytochrome b subunit
MSSAASKADSSYFWDKLHSLSGIIPIGAFLLEHFFENSYALVSPDKFNYVASKLETMPWRVPVEFIFIWLPITFHGIYGLEIWRKSKSNAIPHPWMANWMFTLQRWTGVIAFAYIIWHVWTERFLTHGKSTYAGVAHTFTIPYCIAFYVIGILAASFHLGNGTWQFLNKWGIAVTPRAQRKAAWFGAIVGIAFTVVGLSIIAGFAFGWHPFSGYL